MCFAKCQFCHHLLRWWGWVSTRLGSILGSSNWYCQVSLQAAFQALLTFNWDVQMAVDKILNAHEATLSIHWGAMFNVVGWWMFVLSFALPFTILHRRVILLTKATKQVLSQRNANPQAVASVAIVSMVPWCEGVETMLIDTKFLHKS